MSQTWVEIQQFRSRRNGTLYTVKLSSKGVIGCNCSEWVRSALRSNPYGDVVTPYRECKHTRWVNEHLRQANGLYTASNEIVEI